MFAVLAFSKLVILHEEWTGGEFGLTGMQPPRILGYVLPDWALYEFSLLSLALGQSAGRQSRKVELGIPVFVRFGISGTIARSLGIRSRPRTFRGLCTGIAAGGSRRNAAGVHGRLRQRRFLWHQSSLCCS